MFNKLYLGDFKCFTDDIVNFRKLTLLTGSNGSGKSSIVQALLLLNRAFELQDDSIINVTDTLGVQVGGPKKIVAQNALGKNDCDFCLGIDGNNILFYVDKENGLDLKFKKTSNCDFLHINYVNAERVGPRMIYSAGGEKRIKQDGENAAYLMENADINELRLPDELIIDGRTTKFSSQVESWMSAILGGIKISSKVDAPKAQSELLFSNDMTGEAVLPTLTGFGISYVFPIIVAGLLASSYKDQILIVENPEAHLHPSAQSAIGKFLAIIASVGTQVIVETHSEHVIDGARIQMLIMNQTNDMLVNYIKHHDGKPEIMQLCVSNTGELDDWPDGFFDQKQIDLRQMFTMRMKHGDGK